MVRACSARMRSETSLASERPSTRPVTDCAASTSGASTSMSQTESLPCSTPRMRSSPAPVSMFFFGQLRVRAVAVAVVLHEHEVPDLEEPGVAAVRRAAVVAVALAQVDEDLRVGAARPGRTARRAPPVVAQPLDALGPHAGLLDPELLGLVVVGVDGDPQLVGVDAEQVGDHVPGHGDGLGLEVVAEAEVAEHLEEAQVAVVPTHLFEVVVLAVDPHALLHGGGPACRWAAPRRGSTA